MYTHISARALVYMCVYKREKERKSLRGRERERKKEIYLSLAPSLSNILLTFFSFLFEEKKYESILLF